MPSKEREVYEDSSNDQTRSTEPHPESSNQSDDYGVKIDEDDSSRMIEDVDFKRQERYSEESQS